MKLIRQASLVCIGISLLHLPTLFFMLHLFPLWIWCVSYKQMCIQRMKSAYKCRLIPGANSSRSFLLPCRCRTLDSVHNRQRRVCRRQAHARHDWNGAAVSASLARFFLARALDWPGHRTCVSVAVPVALRRCQTVSFPRYPARLSHQATTIPSLSTRPDSDTRGERRGWRREEEEEDGHIFHAQHRGSHPFGRARHLQGRARGRRRRDHRRRQGTRLSLEHSLFRMCCSVCFAHKYVPCTTCTCLLLEPGSY
jgi:hypothetical protein